MLRSGSPAPDGKNGSADHDPSEKSKGQRGGFLSGLCQIRNLVLGGLLLQTTSIVLLMRYSKTRLDGGHGHKYLASVAVLMAECLKLPFCLAMCARVTGLAGFADLIRTEVVANWRDTLKCSVPAVAYTAQSNLLFIALANLDAPIYQVSYQSKTLFTALFSYLLLGRQLVSSQWLALVLLCAGTVLVSEMGGAAPKRLAGDESTTLGLIAVLSAGILSASSSVYFESMLKGQQLRPSIAPASLWLRNVQLGVFALPLAALAVYSHDGVAVKKAGLMQGFDGLVWLIVVLNGVGGLLVAATMK